MGAPQGIRERRMLREVVSIERDERASRMTLVLKCTHRVEVPAKAPGACPKRGRCDVCKPSPCGATHRDGRTCTIERMHEGLHTGATGRPWNYDARQLEKVAS
jgi:hypothetical protein